MKNQDEFFDLLLKSVSTRINNNGDVEKWMTKENQDLILDSLSVYFSPKQNNVSDAVDMYNNPAFEEWLVADYSPIRKTATLKEFMHDRTGEWFTRAELYQLYSESKLK